MAYNLQPLITILEQILKPRQTRWIHDFNKPQLKSLLEKAISLQQIHEKYSSVLPTIEISLESQIRDAAHKAEDIIESRMVDRMLSSSLIGWFIKWCKCFTFSSPDLQQVMQELDSAMEQVVKLVEVEAGKKMSSSSAGAGALNPKSESASASAVVGFDEDLMELKDRLTGMQRKLEIIPIVGMGGAGKTTLARNLYEDPLIVSRFVARAWTSVSQDYNMQTILLSLVRCIVGKEVVHQKVVDQEVVDREEVDQEVVDQKVVDQEEVDQEEVEVSELKDILYKSLYGRRYMIVLDDIWSTKVWDEMRSYFPDNNNGSRIMITTRESKMAKYADLQSRQHEVQLLSKSASWNLLGQIVFGEDKDYCPSELELIGRKIASDCGGLPLTITVIGGLLSKAERSKYVWENIGKNVRPTIAKSVYEQYSNILSLSYNHLPNYLKPCFLYMGAFPEDYEIKGSTLISLWIAEGFVKSNGSNKSLEEEAEDYLKGLVERNLLIVRRKKLNRKPMTYIIHDLLRDLCIRKADEGKFLHVMTNDRGRGISKLRRVSSEKTFSREMADVYASTELMSLARSFLSRDPRSHAIVRCIASASNLLRVLDIMQIWFKHFPKEILQLVNLRFLSVWCQRLPVVGISRLLNLQTLIAHLYKVSVPPEIWTMSRLRHVNLRGVIIWSPDDIKKLVTMNKLHTISMVELSDSLFKLGFLFAIPNIKKLGISWAFSTSLDFSHLHKLETFRFESKCGDGCRFPTNLRKLTLSGCTIFWRMSSTLCGLPNLEVLKIIKCKFDEFEMNGEWEEEWEPREGEEFRSLQFLQLDELKLVRWRADETNFPKLRHLLVQKCQQLEEIPSCIGDITTLELIEMKSCSAASVESAKQILEVQQSEYDNYALQLRIHDDQ